MFIEEFTDEQILYFRMSLSPDIFSGWFVQPADGRVIGYITFDKNHSPKIIGLEYEDHHYLQLIELKYDSNIYLYSYEEVFDISFTQLEEIKKGKEINQSFLILNPRNK